MGKIIRNIRKIVVVIFCSMITILTVASVYHHIMLSIEKKKIQPIGKKVEVDGYNMNVYTEGIENRKGTIVLLSGSGVTAPIFDYKVLYSKLSNDYKIAVVEKFGYGYSDVSGMERDVATIVEQNRQALTQAGETAPYILMPHSMSALEAIYWAVTYPDEIKAIVGLDMAVPNYYTESNSAINRITLMKLGVFFGAHRIPTLNPVSELGLSQVEIEQHKILSYRNSLNKDVYQECKVVLDNAKIVQKLGMPKVPMLLFTTNYGGGLDGEAWVRAQDEFVSQSKLCMQIKLDCGHNLHYYESDFIAEETIAYLREL